MMKNELRGTAGVVLAAGAASRFGTPKQLATFRGQSLLSWALQACLQSDLAKSYVVLGCEAERIRGAHAALLSDSRIEVLLNERYSEGLSSSLRLGVQAAETTGYGSVMFVLGDAPFVTADLINQVLASFRASDKKICIALHDARMGHPCVFDSVLYPELLSLEGDRGARSVIERHPSETSYVSLQTNQAFVDVDTHADLEQLE